MARIRIFAEDWLKINNLPDFFEILHTCGYLIDCWAMTERPERIVRRFLPARVRADSYVEFTIPKKAGGSRSICAPIQPLKKVQRALGTLLQALFQPSEEAMGFVAGRNIAANARCPPEPELHTQPRFRKLFSEYHENIGPPSPETGAC